MKQIKMLLARKFNNLILSKKNLVLSKNKIILRICKLTSVKIFNPMNMMNSKLFNKKKNKYNKIIHHNSRLKI